MLAWDGHPQSNLAAVAGYCQMAGPRADIDWRRRSGTG
jgi:hypothetical protein